MTVVEDCPVDVPAWRLFERVADDYDGVLPFFSNFGASIVSVLPLFDGCRFLDLGAGRGALAAAAHERGCVVTAIDRAPAMVARLKAQYPAVRAAVMDAEALGLADESFDVVAAAFVLHLLPDPARAAREAHRVLIRGGTFALPADNRPVSRLSTHLDALFAEFAVFRPAGSEFGRPLSAPDILASAGFHSIQQHTATVAVEVPGSQTLWRWLMSHGYRAFVEALPDQRQYEFQQRVLDMPLHDQALGRMTSVYAGRR